MISQHVGNSIVDIYNHVVSFKQYYTSNNITKEYFEKWTKQMEKKTNNLKIIVKSNKLIDTKQIINEYCGELYRIYDYLVGDYAKLCLVSSTIQYLRSFIGTLFDNILGIKMSVKKYFQKMPTIIFNRFCEGITYFETDHHKESSCGEKTMTNSSFDVERKRSTLRRCYIERLIYNDIYNRSFTFQDLSHMKELRSIENLHDDVFSGSNLTIKLFYPGDSIYPEKLTISYNDSGNNIQETYIKQISHSRSTDIKVYCSKQVFSNKGVKYYNKIQSFTREEPWLITSP